MSSGTEKVRITSGGAVGINVNAPTDTLHVAGATRVNGLKVNYTGAFHNSGKFELKGHSTGSHTAMRATDSSGTQINRTRYDNPTTSYVISSDTTADILKDKRGGNVGIGQSSPILKLDVL